MGRTMILLLVCKLITAFKIFEMVLRQGELLSYVSQKDSGDSASSLNIKIKQSVSKDYL